ncbi:MAG TPA: BTAD domain-containing putative transcriptional regulator [Longimicrobiales bacterium]|nr:BTAD domain-containing putative transcriptional regulator [Longimicrobiales bacterium]
MTTTNPTARLCLFGGATLEGDDGPISGRGAQRRRLALLAILAASGRMVSRDKVVAYLWEDADTERARKLLSESLYVIRKALGEDAIVGVGDDLQLNSSVIWSDVAEFRKAIDAGDFETAVSLYNGPFLDGFHLTDAEEFEKWVDGERDAFARARAETLNKLATNSETNGDHHAAAGWWRKLVEQDPYNSGNAIKLMRAMEAIGDRASALQHARVHAGLLRAEFDADPDPEVEAVAQQIRNAPQRATIAKPAIHPVDVVQSMAPAPIAELASPPLTAPIAARPPRKWSYVFAAGVIAIALAGVFVLLNRKTPTATTQGGAIVAVMPFTVRGGGAELRDGMVDLLSTDLDGAGDLHTVDPHAVLSVTGDGEITPRRAANIAQRFGANYYVLGDITTVGTQLQLNATLYETANDRPVGRATTRGAADSVLALTDAIATQLLSARSGDANELIQLSQYTTNSYQALKKYLEGESAYRAARYNAASTALLAALREDPGFALAEYRLSAASEWDFEFIRARHRAERAMKNSERLSDRYRPLARAWYYFLNGKAASAQREYESVLANYPNDVEARSGLGEVLVHFNPVRGMPGAAARDAFDRVLAIAPAYGEVRFHALEFAARERNRPRFDSLMTSLDTANQQYSAWRAVRAFAWGESREQQSALALLKRQDELAIGIAAARLATTHNFEGAKVVASELTRPHRTSEWRAGGHLLLLEAAIATHDWPQAKLQVAKARQLEIDWAMELGSLFMLHPAYSPSLDELSKWRDDLKAWDPSSHSPSLSFFLAVHATIHKQLRAYLIGMTSVRLGDLAAAEQSRRELERLGGGAESQALANALSASLAGHLAARRGEKEKAITLLTNATIEAPPEFIALSPFYARAFDRFALGELNLALHNTAEAKRWFSTFGYGYDFFFTGAAQQRLQ